MIGRGPHAQRRRRWYAAMACLLWLLGVEGLPDLHLAFHDDDHSHGPGGAIVSVSLEAHGHDHGHDHGHSHDLEAAHAGDDHAHAAEPGALVWRDDAPTASTVSLAVPAAAPAASTPAHRDHHRPRRARRDGPSALDEAPPAHAAAGLAHHAVALHRPPPPLLEPLPAPRAAWRLEHAPDRPLHDTLRARPNARGPPATI